MPSEEDLLLPTARPATQGQDPVRQTGNPVSRAWTWLQTAVRRLKRDLVALSLASADPRTPLVAKLWAMLVIGYALSPLDLIPDFIPVLGVLDDLILVPLGIWILLRMIPQDVMADARAQANDPNARLPVNWYAGAVVALVWFACALWIISLVVRWK
jgi:uncharacterized membrane protein YkvA (DUF1232 family)